jgi:hypothetical protein
VTGMYSNQLNYQTNFLRILSTTVEFRNCIMLNVESGDKSNHFLDYRKAILGFF